MSLFALPVSVNDLIQLQQGIEFFTDTIEAQVESGRLIPNDEDSVFGYASTLLANNISFSQVAMAVDSLMFGVTDNTTELAKLSTQFLPPQAATAVAIGINPTVYAAEALGLALAGGNGTSNAFAVNFGSLSVSQFVSEVASLTGINSGAIQGFVQFWISFYTANPNATFGLSVTLAAYGAAFGDTVGSALLNPTANATLDLLVNEVQNALIDNAEGGYQAGIPLLSEPPHLPLQGEALMIPSAGGGTFGPSINLAGNFLSAPYVEFISPAQTGPITIIRAPSTFTLNTQHFGTSSVEIDADGAPQTSTGLVCTVVLGDNTGPETLSGVTVRGYSTLDMEVANGAGFDQVTGLLAVSSIQSSPSDLVLSGNGGGLIVGQLLAKSVNDTGVGLVISGELDVLGTIDASNSPGLLMEVPATLLSVAAGGLTVFGGHGPGNILQGSVSSFGLPPGSVSFSDGSSGLTFGFVGADDITGGNGGGDSIFGDGGPDSITLPDHTKSDTVSFGVEDVDGTNNVLAVTDGMDVAYPGSWGASATKTAIPNLFPGAAGGTSADMTTLAGFRAGSGGDLLDFAVAAWNGASEVGTAFALFATDKGDLVVLGGAFPVQPGAAQLSAVWVNSTSNTALKPTDQVLLYAPSDASVDNAEQLAGQLHSSSDAVVLPGGLIRPGQDKHILVAYDASSMVNGMVLPAVNIADVDLVNAGASPQASTANLNVYASDMVHLVGVSLTSLTSDNLHFI